MQAQNASAAWEQVSAESQNRIQQYVDDNRRVVLAGHRHPLARQEYEVGAAAADFPMQRMVLTLKPTSVQQSALEQLLAAQRDPQSPAYHQWLTPADYGQRFGVSAADLAQIVNWLQWHGMTVEEVSAGRSAIVFSGSAAQVEEAFHTPIHTYMVGGQLHHANASDPEIPQALAQVVGGVVSLHDFRSQSQLGVVNRPLPQFTSGSAHYLTPADYATIYDLAPLYQQNIKGSGQAVAVVARSNINLSDVRQFRSAFGLPANDPQIIVNGTDPGIYDVGEEVEADLDVQWSGALAPSATVKFVVSASTNSSDGVYLSAQYIVNHNVAPVMTTSFGLCEASLGSSGNAFINSLWQQAAAQGITVFVSSGDSGAAGCDSSSATTASAGRGVNGLCSSPYSVCVGGTEFNDSSNPSTYWASSNASGTQASAKSYIPEVVWNESGSSGLWASGGGASTVYTKPSWQTGPGVPADGHRDVPDVSLTAAGHDGYLVYLNGSLITVGGTSAASPSLASIMALVLQQAGARVGNANPSFYALANRQDLYGGAPVFHDITSGNNGVPGLTGFSAGTGYDEATGLGSVDAYQLVYHWSDASIVPGLQLSGVASSIAFAAGSSGTLSLSTSVSGGFNSSVALSVSGLPTGVTAAFTPAQIAAPGSGSSTLRLTAAGNTASGNYNLTISAIGGGLTKTANSTLTILAPASFTLSTNASSLSLAAGKSGTVLVTANANTAFSSALALSVSGLPSGMTASFAPASIAAPGSGMSTLTISTSSALAANSYALTITATGGGVTKTASCTVTVLAAPNFNFSVNSGSLTFAAGKSGSLTLTTSANSTFSSAISLAVSGLPSGMTASFSPGGIAAPGSGTSTLTLNAATSVVPKAYLITITATGGGVIKTASSTVTVLIAPNFSLGVSAAVTVTLGGHNSVTLTTAANATFSSAVSFSVSGLPTGMSASFAPATIAAPGSGTSTLTLSATTGVTPGSYPLTVTASGGGITQSAKITVNVPGFAISPTVGTVTLRPGGTGSVTFNSQAIAGFNSALALSAAVPKGVTQGLSVSTISAPGNGASTLTLTRTPSASVGASTLTFTATGGGITRTVTVIVNVSSN